MFKLNNIIKEYTRRSNRTHSSFLTIFIDVLYIYWMYFLMMVYYINHKFMNYSISCTIKVARIQKGGNHRKKNHIQLYTFEILHHTRYHLKNAKILGEVIINGTNNNQNSMQSTITFPKDISKYQKNHNVPEKNLFKIKIREKKHNSVRTKQKYLMRNDEICSRYVIKLKQQRIFQTCNITRIKI